MGGFIYLAISTNSLPVTDDLEIRHHNALTTARYEYTELQLDLFFFLLSQLRKVEDGSIYSLKISDLSRVTGKEYHYGYLRKATEGMGSRMFEIETPERLRQLWMFRSVEYVKGKGIIEVRLSEDILPYLFDLKNNFTSFELLSALRLTSKHAKRIYQLCSQWKDVGQTKTFDLLDFKRMLGLVDSNGAEEYKVITMFCQKVLDIAVRQINEHTDLRIAYTLEKEGRSYKRLYFSVKPHMMAVSLPELTPHDGSPLPLELPDMPTQNAGRVLAELRITDAQLREQILSNPEHIRAVNRFAHDLKTNRVKASQNPAGLLLTVLGIKKAVKKA